MRAVAALIALALCGCDVGNVRPEPPEVRTTIVAAPTPIVVPCFTEDQRPKFPVPTPINIETATTEQLAAAELADALAMNDYARQVDALYIACQSKGIAP